MALDIESEVLHEGLKLLSRLQISERRRVHMYWGQRLEALPLIDAKGVVLDAHPAEDEPPMIRFIHENRDRQEREPPEAAAGA